MSEWKELKIDDLPSDILTGDYEFEYFIDDKWKRSLKDALWILNTCMDERTTPYRYRKPEPLPPTHEEIMTKWWKIGDRIWVKCITYSKWNKSYFFRDDVSFFEVRDISWFTDRESADIPPEG